MSIDDTQKLGPTVVEASFKFCPSYINIRDCRGTFCLYRTHDMMTVSQTLETI